MIFVFLLCAPLQSWGHDEPATDVAPFQLKQLEIEPVVVSGRKLFSVAGLSAYPAKRRARDIVQRIEDLARDENFDTKLLRTEDTGTYHRIFPGNSRQYLLTITETDARLEGFDRETLAETVKVAITNGIAEYRNDRDPKVLTDNVLLALLRTVVLIALVGVAWWGFRRINKWVEGRIKRRIQKLETQSLSVIKFEQISSAVRIALRVLETAFILLLVYISMAFVMSLFPWTRRTADVLLDWVVDPLVDMGTAVVDFIPDLIFLILLYYVTCWVLRVIRAFFRAVKRGRVQLKGFDPEWAMPTYRILFVFVILFAAVIAYPYIPGSDSRAFQGMSILVGILLSLGSASALSNMIAGYMMIYRRAFKIGDRIKIGNTVGDVVERRVAVTHLLTPKNEEVVIPNSVIMNSEVINYSSKSREKNLILYTTVGIGYEVPWRQVKAMLLLAAERTKGVLKEPKPFVLQKSLSDYAVDYQLNVYSDNAQKMASTYDELHGNIQDVFNEYGVQIMTPSYRADTPDPKIVPQENWYASPARPPEPAES